MAQSRDHLIRRLAPRVMKWKRLTRTEAIDRLCRLSVPGLRKLSVDMWRVYAV